MLATMLKKNCMWFYLLFSKTDLTAFVFRYQY